MRFAGHGQPDQDQLPDGKSNYTSAREPTNYFFGYELSCGSVSTQTYSVNGDEPIRLTAASL